MKDVEELKCKYVASRHTFSIPFKCVTHSILFLRLGLDIKLLILRLTYKLLMETEGSTRLKFTVRFRVSGQRNKAG